MAKLFNRESLEKLENYRVTCVFEKEVALALYDLCSSTGMKMTPLIEALILTTNAEELKKKLANLKPRENKASLLRKLERLDLETLSELVDQVPKEVLYASTYASRRRAASASASPDPSETED